MIKGVFFPIRELLSYNTTHHGKILLITKTFSMALLSQQNRAVAQASG